MADVATLPRPQPEEFRVEELTQLLTWFEAPQGSTVLLQGRRGVGKERLVEALVQKAALLPRALILDVATPLAGGRSFHPFAELAHQALACAEQLPAGRAVIDAVYGDLASVLEAGPCEQPEAASLDQKLRFFDGLRRLLATLSAHHRLLAIVRDLERADSDTLELAAYLADELFGDPSFGTDGPRLGALILVAREETESPPVLKDFLTEMAERRAVKVMRLTGLDLDGLRRYVQSPHVLAKLLSASGGLPQELDALIDALPSNVEELFERKLVSFEALSQQALRALSVFGRPASARLIATVLELPPKQVAKALTDLRDARVLERRIQHGELQFTFNRQRDLEVTERNLSPEERQQLHGKWASALVRESDASPALLAHHQLRSAEPQRGVPLAVQAAESYAVGGALHAALQMLEDAQPHATGELLLTILSRLAELAPLVGHPRRGLRHVEELRRLLPISNRSLADLREAQLLSAAGDHARALEPLARAREATPEFARLDRIKIEIATAEVHHQLGARVEATLAAERGLALIEALGTEAPARQRIELLNQLGKIASVEGRYQDAIQLFQQTHATAEQSGLLAERARALVNIGMAHLRLGDAARAEQLLLDGLEKARAANDISLLGFGYLALGASMHQGGELGRALEFYRESKSVFRRLGNRLQLARVLHNLGALFFLVGDLDRARSHNDEALRLSERRGGERVRALALVVDGMLRAEQLDTSKGEANLREGLALQRKIGPERYLEALLELVEFQLRWQDADTANETLVEVERQVEGTSAVLEARTRYFRGLTTLAQTDNATLSVAPLEQARDTFLQLGRPLFVRDAELALARCQHRLGRREAARLHLAAAQQIQDGIARDLPVELRRVFESARPQRALDQVRQDLDRRPEPRVELKPLRKEPTERKKEWHSRYADIVGRSPKLHRVFHILDRIADSDGSVLILGESGTGKELVAQAIHENSPRAKSPFVKLNCAALVESLLLSELFGHERGSFTGAHQRKIGRFEMAAGGTLFLDEIGDISPQTQVALLRVLQEREFERVGGGKPIKVDARIIVATNRNLAQMVRDGTFREDLYYRLKGLTVELPPLRERPEDIVELAHHFLAQYAAESASKPKTLATDSVALLTGYGWPGNIRELENIVRSVALFAEGSVITASDFDEYRELFGEGPMTLGSGPTRRAEEPVPIRHEAREEPKEAPRPVSAIAPTPVTVAPEDVEAAILKQIFAEGIPLPELKKRIQQEAIARALRMTDGNITRAAEVLGMRRPRLSQIINASDALKALCQGVTR